jgi:tetratricopeptide (TPR) repeat protein
MFASDPSFKRRSVSELNAEAVSFLKDGDDVRCVGAFAKLFRKLLDNHLVHKDLHVCHSNRAAAYLNLGLYEEALWDARQCQRLAEQRFNRDRDANAVAPIFRKAHARKGFALLGLEMPRQAKCSFEAGLAMQPDCVECKRGLEEALARIARDILEGRGLETLALPASAPVAGKIANLPHAGAHAPRAPAGRFAHLSAHAVPGGQRVPHQGHVQLHDRAGGHQDASEALQVPAGQKQARRVRQSRTSRDSQNRRRKKLRRARFTSRVRRRLFDHGGASRGRAPRRGVRPVAVPRDGVQGEPAGERLRG